VTAAHVRLGAPGDPATGRDLVIAARHIVNATGIFAEQVEALTGEVPQLDIEPSKGVHLVVRREALTMGADAVVLPETSDRRIIFVVPWRSRVIIGTTDTGSGDLDRPRADATDVDFLLGHLNRSIRRPLARAEILGTYAGYRPLLRLRHSRSPARLSRSHAVVEGSSGLISVSGGKLTTYRVMARDAVDRIDARVGGRRLCRTADWPLAGAVGWPAARAALAARGADLGLDEATLAHLGASLGTLANEVLDLVEVNPVLGARLDPELPAIVAEAVYAGKNELALTVEDVLERRLRLGIEAADHGIGAATVVGEILSAQFGWSASEGANQISDYAAHAALHDAGGVGRDALPQAPVTASE
jgi:glycerol-3-phosphate dehydrogenase